MGIFSEGQWMPVAGGVIGGIAGSYGGPGGTMAGAGLGTMAGGMAQQMFYPPDMPGLAPDPNAPLRGDVERQWLEREQSYLAGEGELPEYFESDKAEEMALIEEQLSRRGIEPGTTSWVQAMGNFEERWTKIEEQYRTGKLSEASEATARREGLGLQERQLGLQELFGRERLRQEEMGGWGRLAGAGLSAYGSYRMGQGLNQPTGTTGWTNIPAYGQQPWTRHGELGLQGGGAGLWTPGSGMGLNQPTSPQTYGTQGNLSWGY